MVQCCCGVGICCSALSSPTAEGLSERPGRVFWCLLSLQQQSWKLHGLLGLWNSSSPRDAAQSSTAGAGWQGQGWQPGSPIASLPAWSLHPSSSRGVGAAAESEQATELTWPMGALEFRCTIKNIWTTVPPLAENWNHEEKFPCLTGKTLSSAIGDPVILNNPFEMFFFTNWFLPSHCPGGCPLPFGAPCTFSHQEL